MDFLWRTKASRLVAATKPKRILDLATGSGDLALELRKACPGADVVGGDFCLPMLAEAKKKNVPWLVQADGLNLPFRDSIFDALTVAFGLRNMASWSGALTEMARVLRPGGLVLVMDFSMPPAPIKAIYRVYLHHGLPRLAEWITGNREAYQYLGQSIESFPKGCAMKELMESTGFSEVREYPLFFGVAAIYTGIRK